MLSRLRLSSVRHCLTNIEYCRKFSHPKILRYLTRSLTSQCNPDTLQSKKPSFNEVLPVNKFVSRSHTCGELTSEDIGEVVHLCGWVEFQRMNKFLTLRDSYGSTQLIIPDEKPLLMKVIEQTAFESVVSVIGKVVSRPEGQKNSKMTTGAIEILVDDLKVLNEAATQLPFYTREHNVPKESLQMQYRYLALRLPYMQQNLRLRSTLMHKIRGYLIDECGFVDVETPTLFRRTPGGAQEFVVPTRNPGHFYSLVQSPQQFKQLLMIGGIDRYFQIARCYRDESGRADRQPEFTQLDIEMSFVDREGIMNLVEGLLEHCWLRELDPLTFPIPRLSFEDVMETYGTDQPDLRIPYRIFNVSPSLSSTPDTATSGEVYLMTVPGGSDFLTTSAKALIDDIRKNKFEDVKLVQMKAVNDSWRPKLEKMGLKIENLMDKVEINDKDALFVTFGTKNQARQLMGKIRIEFTNIMENKGQQVRSKGYKFLWITDFPLCDTDVDGKLKSTHHPFTAIHPDDVQYFPDDLTKVRGLHYDLVLNGWEIAGGSIRIHNANLQKQILTMLNIDESQMKHLLEALDSGAPPHGGIAFGMDRLVSIICEAPSIRSVIAFPKTMEGRDLMSGAPADISNDEKILYHLK